VELAQISTSHLSSTNRQAGAPPTVDSTYGGHDWTQLLWQRSGYITVADGSCWNINVGRNADNVGTISFNQVTPGSLCAS
jgi:hypothetical protein